MGATNFPNGINIGGGGDVSGFAAGSVVVTGGSINVATGLSSVLYAGVSVLGPLSSTAGTVGGFVVPSVRPIGASGGSICIQGYDQMGTASTTAGTCYWQAWS